MSSWQPRRRAPPSDPAVPPILQFSDPSEFRTRHGSATTEEFLEQQLIVDEFNKEEKEFSAWVIMAPGFKQHWRGYIFRVSLTKDSKVAPGIGQSCRLRFVNNDGEASSWFFCRRGPEVISMHESWSSLIELVVDVPGSGLGDFEECLVPLFDGAIMPSKTVRIDRNKSVTVQLQLEVSKATMLAELGALDRLVNGKAGKGGIDAFHFLMDFKKPTKIVDLYDTFPHLANLNDIPDSRLREELKKVVDGFDEDQTKAMLGMSSLPEGICFVPGGPGAGKTWWVLMMAIRTSNPSCLYTRHTPNRKIMANIVD